METSSIDDTSKVAELLGTRVIACQWKDDFSAARNECLRHATGDSTFWIDADEWLTPEMFQRSGPEPATGGYSLVPQVRLFRRPPDVYGQYRVHEQLLPTLRRSGAKIIETDIASNIRGIRSRPSCGRSWKATFGWRRWILPTIRMIHLSFSILG